MDATNVEHDEAVERIRERTRGREQFRREQRLRSPLDFQRVRRAGRQVLGSALLMSYARQPGAAGGEVVPSRVGFSVSKRVGNAVVRNRVKRRLRESTRRQLAMLPGGWDIILVARASAALASFQALDTDVRDLLERAKLRSEVR